MAEILGTGQYKDWYNPDLPQSSICGKGYMTEFFVTLYNVICNALTLGTDTASKNVFSYVDACMIVLTLRVQATREEFSLPTPFHWSTIFSVDSYTGLLQYFQSLCEPNTISVPSPGMPVTSPVSVQPL